MSTEPQHTCPSCGNEFSGAIEFCPVCMLRKALAGGVESGESSASEDTVKPPPVHRFENYELMLDEEGRPIELGHGAMGVAYKALDVDQRGFVFCGRRARQPAFVIQTLPPCYTWAEPGAVTSMRWSLWRERPLSI